MSRDFFAKDDSICLYRVSDEDKENYTKLIEQGIESTMEYKISKMTDVFWDLIVHGNDDVFVIFNAEGVFCGKVVLYNPQSEHPEIGVGLLKDHRNKGIAKRVIRILMCETRKQYYIVKIAADNMHSQHVFEKMGAIRDEREESSDSESVEELKELLEDTDDEGMKMYLIKLIHEHEKRNNKVYRYRLYPGK